MIFLKYTDNHCPESVLDVAKKSDREAITRILRKLKANGATAEQISAAESITGKLYSVGIPTSGNVKIHEHARERCLDGLKQLLKGARDLTYIRLVTPNRYQGGNTEATMITRKGIAERQLRSEFANYLARFRPGLVDGQFGEFIDVIAWNDASCEGPSNGSRPRFSSIQFKEACRCPIPGMKQGIAAAVASIFEISVLDPDPRDVKLTSHQRTLEVYGFLVNAQTEITKTLFGHGQGKILQKYLKGEFKARAHGLDLARRAPISAEAIPSLLASLPSDADGARYTLPVVTQLR